MIGQDTPNGVIVAENDALMRSIIRSVLLQAEQQVFPAADGLEAVMLAHQFRARAVLLDIGMPRLNGLLACQAIRQVPGYANVPIIMLTGYDDERMRQAAQRLGARDFITKPFRPDVLLSCLAAYLDIPAHAPQPGPAGRNAADLGGRAKVWNIHQDPVATFVDGPQLINGREMMRICRSAERKPDC